MITLRERIVLLCTKILRFKEKQIIKVQMKCFFIAKFERAAKIREIAFYHFLIPLLVPKL